MSQTEKIDDWYNLPTKILYEAENIVVTGSISEIETGYTVYLQVSVMVNGKLKTHFLKINADEKGDYEIDEFRGMLNTFLSLGYHISIFDGPIGAIEEYMKILLGTKEPIE